MSQTQRESRVSNAPKDVRVFNLTKVYHGAAGRNVAAVNDVSLDIAPGTLVTLLGPSGCGKTTVLRMIAGFETPTSGSIHIGDRMVNNVPPNRRDLAMVFQSYALFPHMSVFENVAYGLRMRRLPQSEVQRRVWAMMEMMHLEGCEERAPNQLSGGQQQRVALARALVVEPSVLLLDEPLSNLDAKLRIYMRDEIRSLQQRLGITAIYVTHDQQEALSLSDRVVVINRGRVEQVGTPQEIYQRPNTEFVATFVGTANFLQGSVLAQHGEEVAVRVMDQHLTVPSEHRWQLGEPVMLLVRPEAIHLGREDETFTGIVRRVSFLGASVEYQVEVGGNLLNAVEPAQVSTPLYSVEDRVSLNLEHSSLHLLPASDHNAAFEPATLLRPAVG
ncbi:MAG: ABC transporter ATP-binding protein [Firmicutes bacterium]|nr:ABC transporter ATP-binding protein [Bacillota bacterium]